MVFVFNVNITKKHLKTFQQIINVIRDVTDEILIDITHNGLTIRSNYSVEGTSSSTCTTTSTTDKTNDDNFTKENEGSPGYSGRASSTSTSIKAKANHHDSFYSKQQEVLGVVVPMTACHFDDYLLSRSKEKITLRLKVDELHHFIKNCKHNYTLALTLKREKVEKDENNEESTQLSRENEDDEEEKTMTTGEAEQQPRQNLKLSLQYYDLLPRTICRTKDVDLLSVEEVDSCSNSDAADPTSTTTHTDNKHDNCHCHIKMSSLELKTYLMQWKQFLVPTKKVVVVTPEKAETKTITTSSKPPPQPVPRMTITCRHETENNNKTTTDIKTVRFAVDQSESSSDSDSPTTCFGDIISMGITLRESPPMNKQCWWLPSYQKKQRRQDGNNIPLHITTTTTTTKNSCSTSLVEGSCNAMDVWSFVSKASTLSSEVHIKLVERNSGRSTSSIVEGNDISTNDHDVSSDKRSDCDSILMEYPTSLGCMTFLLPRPTLASQQNPTTNN